MGAISIFISFVHHSSFVNDPFNVSFLQSFKNIDCSFSKISLIFHFRFLSERSFSKIIHSVKSFIDFKNRSFFQNFVKKIVCSAIKKQSSVKNVVPNIVCSFIKKTTLFRQNILNNSLVQ